MQYSFVAFLVIHTTTCWTHCCRSSKDKFCTPHSIK